MAGGGGGGKTTSESAPWKGVQGYLSGLYGSAQSQLMNKPTQFYPGQTFANFSQPTQDALDQTSNFAYKQLGGLSPYSSDPTVGTAQNYLSNVVGGQYLNSAPSQANPYIAGIEQATGDNVQQQVGARFAGSGRSMGSPGETQQFGRDLANTMAPIRYQAAEAQFNREQQQRQFERQAQQQAAMALPGIAGQEAQLGMARDQMNNAQGYGALQALSGVGQAYDAQNQLPIDEAMRRWEYQQAEPYNRLNQYANILGSGSPFTQQTQQSQAGKPGAAGMAGGALSGAASGAAIGSMFGPGYGTAIGAVGGGLAGLFGGFSDRRLKRCIQRIGTGLRGLPLYRFKYLWSDAEYVGHMADEVRAVAPWAVTSVAGYDYVLYGAI